MNPAVDNDNLRLRQEWEWAVLKWLCLPAPPVPDRLEVLKVLTRHATEVFQEQTHQVVLDEIYALREQPFERLCELLPARVTNRGLPDVDFPDLFGQTKSACMVSPNIFRRLEQAAAWTEEESALLAEIGKNR